MKNSANGRHDARPVEIPSHALGEQCCSRCEGDLDLHQPNPATPERLLATCNDCGAWFLVDMLPDDAMARMTWLSPPAVPAPHFKAVTKARSRSHERMTG